MMKSVNKEYLVALANSILSRNGLPEREINVVISHLLEEELMGKSSHGFYRLPGIVNKLRNETIFGDIQIIDENLFSALVDGANHLGLVVAQDACDKAISIASKNGIAIVAAKNYVGTTGAMGYFTRNIAKHNLIGICFCNSEYAVAPWGGKDPILGTNPLSIGIPCSTNPIIIDFATAARTYGELMLAAKEGRAIPEGIVLDAEGKPSTNPNDANDGCQLPMAEHKGYGLGLAIEILSGTFIGCKAGKEAVSGSDGLLFIVVKPNLFVTKEQFLNNTDMLIKEIKNSALAYGFDEIRIPGESSFQTYETNKLNNNIELNESVLDDIIALSNK